MRVQILKLTIIECPICEHSELLFYGNSTIVTFIWISKGVLILNTSSFILRSTIWTIYYHVPNKTQSVVLIRYVNTFYNCGDKAELGNWVGEKRSKIFLNKLLR